MDELSRIELASQLLEELNVLCTEKDQRAKVEIMYSFLVGENESTEYDETFCANYGLEQKLLNTYKKDSWLLILLDAYEYLIAFSDNTELSAVQQSFLTKLDSLPFDFTNLYAFFTSSEHYEEILEAIKCYYEYLLKGNKFIKKRRDYNFSNQSEIRNRLTAYVGNIEAMDFLAVIFDDLDTEYQRKIGSVVNGEEEFEEADGSDYEEEFDEPEVFDEDFNEEEYRAAIDEMFDEDDEQIDELMEQFKIQLHTKVMDFLEEYFVDKFECDEFVGFFMSYVYKFILQNKKKGPLFEEEEQLLKVLENEDFSTSLIVETFYSTPEYVFAALDTFCRYYYKNDCDILTVRDIPETSIERKRLTIMDEYFPHGAKIGSIRLIDNPYYEIYDMVYMKFKLDYHDDYTSKLFLALTTAEIDPVFLEFDLEDDINYHRLMMIRYFSRKCVEALSTKDMKEISSEEYEAFSQLLNAELDQTSLIQVFARHGVVILNGYTYLLDKNIAEEKAILKGIHNLGYSRQLFKIDPGMISDSLYYRALNDTPLFTYVERNGVEQTIKYLTELSRTDYEQYEDYMKEVFASLYCSFEQNSELDSVDNIVKMAIDNPDYDLSVCFKTVINDSLLMYQFLSKYYEIENIDGYPKPIEERIAEQYKVKQKLYPVAEEDNRNS